MPLNASKVTAMIKGITGGNGLIVEGGATSLPWTTNNSNDSFQGMLRINSGNIEYYQNGSWMNLPSSYATVKLDPSAESALNWVKARQAEEGSKLANRMRKEQRAKEHPSLSIAWDAVIAAEENRDTEVKKAMENFDILDKLVGKEPFDPGVSAG